MDPTPPEPEALVQQLFSRIGEISSLPTVAVRIIEVANDPTTAADDLLQAVQYDTALAMRIIRTVNSSYYALQNKVGDLKLAITLLGFKEIRNLAMTAYIAQLFKKEGGYANYTREGLWNHMIGVAVVADLIAKRVGGVPPREAYLAGLLHDLGWILIDQYLHKPFCRVLDRLSEDCDVCELEFETLGFNHGELGEFVASKWNLPEHLIATIRHHHDPLEYDGEHKNLVNVVSLANFLCHLKGYSSLGVPNKIMPPIELFAELRMNDAMVAEIWKQLDDVLQSANIMAMMHGG
jgi:putative nucleotidyltransferase with HDIG domain